MMRIFSILTLLLMPSLVDAAQLNVVLIVADDLGFSDLGRPGYRGRISEDSVTSAEVLRDQNYRSFLSAKWHLGTPMPRDYVVKYLRRGR